MNTPTVILFDVDGTLVSTGGAGRRAIERGFATVVGTPGIFDFSFAGMTDRAIVRLALTATGHRVTPETVERVLDHYLSELELEVRGTAEYLVHPGIDDVLDALNAIGDIAVGLGTGNVERGARIKLDRGSLNERFEFGGFGCDAEDRAELIAAGLRRGAQRLMRPAEDCRLIVIGDTPKDVAAAHANGGVCVAVATGGATADELRTSGARWVLDDLRAMDVAQIVSATQ